MNFFSTLRIRSTVIIRKERTNTLEVAIIDVPVIQDTWNKIFIRTVQAEKLRIAQEKKTTSLKTRFCLKKKKKKKFSAKNLVPFRTLESALTQILSSGIEQI